MGRARTSIADLMIFTTIIALHCLAARAILNGLHDSLYAAVGLIMADVLTAGLVSLRRRKRAGNLAGFEAGGWSALLLYAACCVLASGPMQVFGNSMFSIVSAVTGLERPGGMPSSVGAYVNLAAVLLTHSAILLVPHWSSHWSSGSWPVASPLGLDRRTRFMSPSTSHDGWGLRLSPSSRPS